MLDIKITRTTAPKAKPTGKLGFGKLFTDHMFVMDYTRGKGWHDPRIVPVSYTHLFRNEDRDGAFSVVYRRNDGGYGVLVDKR